MALCAQPEAVTPCSNKQHQLITCTASWRGYGECPTRCPGKEEAQGTTGSGFNAAKPPFPPALLGLFRALFASNWSNSDKRVYKIKGTSPEMMRLIIEYAYTRTVPVTVDNVQSLLTAADQFNVMGIVGLCSEFLKSQLCSKNCIGIWRFADYCYCPDLREAAFVFILHHFEEMSRLSAEFLDISVNELMHILEKDELNVKREEAVFEAILKWIDHAPQDRRRHIAVLLGQVGALWPPGSL